MSVSLGMGGRGLPTTVLEVQTGGSAVFVRVPVREWSFNCASGHRKYSRVIQAPTVSTIPTRLYPKGLLPQKKLLATWSWSRGRRGPVWTFQVAAGKCSECGHYVNQLHLQPLRLQPGWQRVCRISMTGCCA